MKCCPPSYSSSRTSLAKRAIYVRNLARVRMKKKHSLSPSRRRLGTGGVLSIAHSRHNQMSRSLRICISSLQKARRHAAPVAADMRTSRRPGTNPQKNGNQPHAMHSISLSVHMSLEQTAERRQLGKATPPDTSSRYRGYARHLWLP